jgi:hypothetical protein
MQVRIARTGGLRSRFGVRGTFHPEESQRAQVGVRFATTEGIQFFWGGGWWWGTRWHETRGETCY